MFDRADWKFAARLVREGHWLDVRQWIESRRMTDYLLRKPSPWLSLPAIRWLRRFLAGRRGLRVFEYGSGGSTLFWLRHGCECVSIEHDARWSATVRTWVGVRAKLDLRHVPPQPDASERFDPANPSLYQSSSPEFARHHFRHYVEQIDDFPDAHFDLVVVDGRSRPACVAHAVVKVRAGGVLVLDNADRPHYLRHVQASLAGFERRSFVGALPTLPQMNQTDLFVRRH